MSKVVKRYERRKPTVLIVDDLEDNLRILSLAIKELDLNILTATSGEQALKIASENRLDLILLDILIPNVDGYEVCRRIKSEENISSVPIYFITALSNLDHIIRGYHLGADGFITKPYNGFEVTKVVKRHLDLINVEEERDYLINILKENDIEY
jgi:DNA-binding response OmpR family regulator